MQGGVPDPLQPWRLPQLHAGLPVYTIVALSDQLTCTIAGLLHRPDAERSDSGAFYFCGSTGANAELGDENFFPRRMNVDAEALDRAVTAVPFEIGSVRSGQSFDRLLCEFSARAERDAWPRMLGGVFHRPILVHRAGDLNLRSPRGACQRNQAGQPQSTRDMSNQFAAHCRSSLGGRRLENIFG